MIHSTRAFKNWNLEFKVPFFFFSLFFLFLSNFKIRVQCLFHFFFFGIKIFKKIYIAQVCSVIGVFRWCASIECPAQRLLCMAHLNLEIICQWAQLLRDAETEFTVHMSEKACRLPTGLLKSVWMHYPCC